MFSHCVKAGHWPVYTGHLQCTPDYVKEPSCTVFKIQKPGYCFTNSLKCSFT